MITLDELDDGKFNLFSAFTENLSKHVEKAGGGILQQQTVSRHQGAQVELNSQVTCSWNRLSPQGTGGLVHRLLFHFIEHQILPINRADTTTWPHFNISNLCWWLLIASLAESRITTETCL